MYLNNGTIGGECTTLKDHLQPFRCVKSCNSCGHQVFCSLHGTSKTLDMRTLVALVRGEDTAQMWVVDSRDAGEELHGNMQRGIVSLEDGRRVALQG